jgi:hypothetical protein
MGKMTTRTSFVETFGEEEATRVEDAAESHLEDFYSTRGSDYFRWCICICLGFQCMEVDRYREYHGIIAPWSALKTWVKEHGDLANHDGDVDTLAYGSGVYEEYGLTKTISNEEISEVATKTMLDMISSIASGDGPKRKLR